MFLLWLALASTVSGGPFVREYEQARAAAARLSRSPEAMAPLYRIVDLEESLPADSWTIEVPAHPLVAAHAAWLRAALAEKRGRREPLAIGTLDKWWIVGPFDNEGRKGFAEAYPPEK